MTSHNSDSRLGECKRMSTEFTTRESEASGSGAGANFNPYSNLPPLPFKMPDQQYCLLNIAHINQRPRCRVPGFRILGAFETKEALKAHVQRVGMDAYGGAALHIAEMHKKTLLCTSLERQQNSVYTLGKIEALTAKYLDILDFHDREFDENRKNKTQGKTGLSKREKNVKHSSREILMDKKFEDLKTSAQETGVVSRIAEVRMQEFCVVSIIDDTSPEVLRAMEDPEPVVVVWGCFESEDKAKHYIYNTAEREVNKLMLDVYSMYQWIYPTLNDVDKVEEGFRDKRLEKIMNAKKKGKSNVLSFEQWCKRENREVPVQEINVVTDESGAVVNTEIKTLDTGITATVSTRDSKDGSAVDHLDDFNVVQAVSEDSKYKSVSFDAVKKEPPRS